MILPRKLQDVRANINRWNQRDTLQLRELSNLATSTRAVWKVGNCIIQAERSTDTETEIDFVAVKLQSPDKLAWASWSHLGGLFVEAKWINQFDPSFYSNVGLIVDEAIVETDEERWKEQRRRAYDASGFSQASIERKVDAQWRVLQELKETVKPYLPSVTKEAKQRIHQRQNLTTEEAGKEYLKRFVADDQLTTARVIETDDLREVSSALSKRANIRVPTKPTVNRRWKATWAKVKGEVKKGKSPEGICAWLSKADEALACSTDTLRDIIRAGEAGLLENSP